MGQRNPIYNDYRRRRSREKWLKRLPALLAAVAVLVVAAVGVGVVLPRVQGQGASVAAPVTPAAQVTLAATATPGALVVMPAGTVAPMPTATAWPTVVAATALPTEMPLSTPMMATTTPRSQPLPQGEGSLPSTPQSLPTGDGSQMDVPALQKLMLDLINADRQANGLTPVQWDEGAAQAATAHAEDMAAQGYFSHWNTLGQGPDVRFGLAGGTDVIRENVAAQWRRYDDGRPAPIEDWSEVIREAQTGLMNSPGHRANILEPFHTHVGVGIAYNAQTGETRIAQEFIHRYVALEEAPALNGDAVELNWTLLNGATEPLINVAFEPTPTPLTPDDLNNRMPRTYSSPAEIIDVLQPEALGNGRFGARVPVGQKGAGLYHLRIWVEVNGEQVPGANVIVPVGAP